MGTGDDILGQVSRGDVAPAQGASGGDGGFALPQWFDEQASAGPPIQIRAGMEAPRELVQGQQVHALDPGRQYLVEVRVQTAPAPSQDGSYELWENELTVALGCPECPDLFFRTWPVGGEREKGPIPGSYTVPRARLSAAGLRLPFGITVPENVRRVEQARLELRCSGGRNAAVDHLVEQRVAPVHGEQVQIEQTWLAQLNIDPSAEPPASFAFLYAEYDESGGIRLSGRSRYRRLELEAALADPRLSLANLVQQQRAPDTILANVRDFASGSQLRPWREWVWFLLERAQENEGDAVPALIVVDLTSAEIPWELMEFDEGCYLGAELEVSRWADISGFETVQLHHASSQVRGRPVHWLDASAAHSVEPEKNALTVLGSSPLADIKALKHQLIQGVEGIGLIYIASHGEFHFPEGRPDRQQLLFSTGQRGAALFSHDLINLNRAPDPLPVVVVNACHSGRLLSDATGRYGFPAVFLARVARAYLGTLGPVGQHEAAEYGRRLLQEIIAHRDAGAAAGAAGVRIADFLRRLRKEVVTQFNAAAADTQRSQRVLFAFMYVYYGNPLLAINFSPPGTTPQGAGQ